MWLGLVVVEVLPSPKFQEREAIVPSLSLELSVKLTTRPLTVSLKFATGGTLPVPPPPMSAATEASLKLPKPVARSQPTVAFSPPLLPVVTSW